MRAIALERAEYEQRRESIVAAYEGQYIACMGGEVVDHDADFGVLARRVYARFGRRAIFLTKVTRSRSVSVVGAGVSCR